MQLSFGNLYVQLKVIKIQFNHAVASQLWHNVNRIGKNLLGDVVAIAAYRRVGMFVTCNFYANLVGDFKIAALAS